MTDETQGQAAPTTEQAQPAPAVSEQATQTDTSVQNTDAAAENAETTAQETEQAEGSETEPRKLTRSQRQQRKLARLSTMLAEKDAELDRLRTQSAKSTAESEPKAADYPQGEYDPGFLSDLAAHKAASKIEAKLSERDERENKRQITERQQEAVDDFLERADATRKLIPDYDATVAAFANQGGKFEHHVIEEIRDSEKGPELAYHIAKTPGLAAELNALSPRDAAREIGRLEAKLSLPQPRKQTQAPAPLTPLKGGAAPSTDIRSLAKSDDASAYIAARRAQRKAGA
jgi:hypothetical protein